MAVLANTCQNLLKWVTHPLVSGTVDRGTALSPRHPDESGRSDPVPRDGPD
jgi:hypothetical protein